MTSYLTTMDSISLSRTVFEIFDFKVFRVWPWPLTPKGHLGSKKIIPFEKPYMTSYLTFMDTISLSRTFFEIFDFKVFRVRLWPLTLKVIWGQKKLYHSKGHIWLPIWLLWTPSLYLVPFSRYSTSKFSGFDFDLWPPKVIWGQKKLYHSKGHIWLPIWHLWTPSLYLYLHTVVRHMRTMNTISLGFDLHTVAPLGHLRIMNTISLSLPFDRPYMTYYLRTMNTISLSRTVFDTVRLYSFEDMNTISLSLTFTKVCLHLRIMNTISLSLPFDTAIYDLLFDFYEHHLSISYRFRHSSTLQFWGYERPSLYLWPSLQFVYIWGSWTPSLYLYHSTGQYMTYYLRIYEHHLSISYRFRHSLTLQFWGYDLDLWPLKVMWGRKKLYHSKGHIWLPIWLLWTPSLYLVPFSRYYDFKVFRVMTLTFDPQRSSGVKKNLYHSTGQYMTYYLTFMNTISLSRTVFDTVRLENF